jgi:hypothetical protein
MRDSEKRIKRITSIVEKESKEYLLESKYSKYSNNNFLLSLYLEACSLKYIFEKKKNKK